jgi:hypothetical protein
VGRRVHYGETLARLALLRRGDNDKMNKRAAHSKASDNRQDAVDRARFNVELLDE